MHMHMIQLDPLSGARHERMAWVLAILGLGLAGCSVFTPPESTPQECTLIGCVDALTISLIGNVPDGFTIEVVADDGTTLRARCTDDDEARDPESGVVLPDVLCRKGSIVFFRFAPEEVNIRFAWQGGEAAETAHPVYDAVRPNGPDCPPECRVGHVEFEIP
jgi:hypothetical protein